MPRSAGVYALPLPPFVPGSKILTSAVNENLADIALALTGSMPRDGTAPMISALSMGNNRVTGLADATANTDAAALGQVGARYLSSFSLAANPAFVEFALPTTFNSYEIQFENVTPSLNAFMACQFSRDGGSNWISNPSDYASGWYGSLSPGFGTTATGSQGLLTFTVTSTATAPLRGVMRFALPAATGAARWACETGAVDASSGFQAATTYHGTVISGTRPNRLRIYWSAGVWTSLGAVALHGVRA